MDMGSALNVAGMAMRVKNQVRSFDPSCIDDTSKGQPVDFAKLALSRLVRADDGGIPPSMDLALLRMAVADSPIQLLPEHLEVLLVEASLQSAQPRSTIAKLRTKLRDNPISVDELIDRMSDLSPMFIKGMECRLTGMCDFCDMCVVISNHTRLPHEYAFKFFGGAFGHAAVVGGKSPLKHLPLAEVCKTFPFSRFGVREDEVMFKWRPANAVSRSDIKRDLLELDFQRLKDANPQMFYQTPSSPSYNPVSPELCEPSAPPLVDFEPIEPAPCVTQEIRIATPIPRTPPPKPKRLVKVVPVKKTGKVSKVARALNFFTPKKDKVESPVLKPKKAESLKRGMSASSAQSWIKVVDTPTRP